VQGLLGGFRVKLDALMGANLALVHGSFASVVFSLLVSLAVVTSPSWHRLRVSGQRSPAGQRLRYGALTITGLVFLQIVLGAVLRHTYSPWGQRGHLLTAFAVVGGVVWLSREIFGHPARSRSVTIAATLLDLFVAFQLLLGTEAWMMKYFAASAPAMQALIRTAHVLMGHLILASTVVTTLYVFRLTAVASVQVLPDAVNRLEGAA
jgi:cytochrome c oxidase assembly protein subunit 15